MFGRTIDVTIMLITISVYPSFGDENSISCTSDANSIHVKWSVTEDADHYVVSWYSLNEYHRIAGNNAPGFRNFVLEEHEKNMNIYYGLNYGQAFEDTADAFGMRSHGYIISPGGKEEELTVTSRILPNTTYDISTRITGRSPNVTTLICEVTTYAVEDHISEVSTTTSDGKPSQFELDPLILYVIIPGTVMSLLTITLIGIMLNRKWRMKILREKTPVRVIASRGSQVDSQVTISIGYSSDSRPSSSDSLLNWSKKNKIGIASNLTNRKKTREGRYRHYVVNPAETFVPSPSPVMKSQLPNIAPEDSYDEDDPFDRLHHRHSLTTVTEESDSSDDDRRNGERYARFSARTIDSRLTSRECSFVTYKSNTPISRGVADFQSEQNYTMWSTTQRDNIWTSLSNHYVDGYDDMYARGRWFSENQDSSVYDADNEFPHSHTEERRIRGGRRRPWIDRRQRRVTPSVLHVAPLTNPSYSVLRVSEEGARLLGHPSLTERENKRNATPALGVGRQGTPGVDQRNQFTYQSPHARQQPQSSQRSSLRTTKSSRNIPCDKKRNNDIIFKDNTEQPVPITYSAVKHRRFYKILRL